MIDWSILAAIGFVILAMCGFAFLVARLLRPAAFEAPRKRIILTELHLGEQDDLSPSPFVDAVATPDPSRFRNPSAGPCPLCGLPMLRDQEIVHEGVRAISHMRCALNPPRGAA